jgi:phage FluMu protein Com
MRDKNYTPFDVRCEKCGRLLARVKLESGMVELVCPKCKIKQIVRASRPNIAPHDGLKGDRHAQAHSEQR